MRRFGFISLVIILFAMLIAGCGANTPQPIPEPTPVPEIDQPEPEPETEPTESASKDAPPEGDEAAPVEFRIGINANLISPLVVEVRGTPSGFEIELAEEIAKRLYGDEVQIEWVPITSQERFTSLADGQIDMLVRSLVHTTSREEQALFSGAYLLVGNGFLVPDTAGYTSVADLDGKTVAVIPQYEEGLNQVSVQQGITLIPMVVENGGELPGMMSFDEVDAIYHDWLFLAGLLDASGQTILPDGAQYAPMGIGFALDNPGLRDVVDKTLMEMIADGTWQALFDKWVGVPNLWDLEGMFSTPPLDQ